MKKTRISYKSAVFIALGVAILITSGIGFVFSAEKGEKAMDSPFGVLEFLHWNHDWNSYKYPDTASLKRAVNLMKKAGVGWVRQDFLWSDIEPKEGEFDFTKYDEIVDIVTSGGMRILGILHYGTSWSSDSGLWNAPASDNKLFVNYAVKVIERYKGKVKYWEVWNEPDSGVYWMPQDGLKRYCTLLGDVYKAAKAVDPECLILNGGFSNPNMSVNRLYENGAKDYFDIMNIHIFESPSNPVGLKAIASYVRHTRKKMVQNGDMSKKIWVTEIGCPGVPPDVKTGNWWMGKNPTENQQARWVRGIYTELLKNQNVEKIFWAFFRDTKGHWGDGVDYFGLVRWNFSRKPAYFMYKKAYDEWKSSR